MHGTNYTVTTSHSYENDFYKYTLCLHFQALVGVAYSIGFIVGPTIGAVFASRSSIESGNLYYLPAVFASVLILVDIIFVLCCFKDTLPPEKRVNDMTITGNGV